MARGFSRFLLFPAFLVGGITLTAQQPQVAQDQLRNADLIRFGQASVALDGPWKFQIGDSPVDDRGPVWANPGFDDSAWEVVNLASRAGAYDPTFGISGYVPGWTAKGHPGRWGYGWYRTRLQISAQPGQALALAGPANVDDGYQVFANGTLVGSFGQFAGGGRVPVVYFAQPQIFKIPERHTGGGMGTEPATLVLAFRVWMHPNTLHGTPEAGGIHVAPLLGEVNVIHAQYQVAWLELVRAYASAFLMGVAFFLLACVACSITLFDRTDKVYLWLTATFLLNALDYAEVALASWTQVEGAATYSLHQYIFLTPLTLLGWIVTWWLWFQLRRPEWMLRVFVGLTLVLMISQALQGDFFFVTIAHPVAAAFSLASRIVRLLFLLLLVYIAAQGIRTQGREGWFALPAMLLQGFSSFSDEIRLSYLHTYWFPFGIQVSLPNISDLVLLGTMLALLMRRLMLSLRRQREMALDVKQAREIQRVMLPEAVTLPGLAIETEYRPAREVGGDFFQIIHHKSDGSLLIVAGDVTGKGLRAGMLVALLVGAIRMAVETITDPLMLLQALNRRLLGRSDAQATGLALRIENDGAVTLANAGHIAPYLNGEPVEIEGSLPLGMIEAADFSVMRFMLHERDRLVLMSDGISEATDVDGNLFGFDRVIELLRKTGSIADLANAAQKFGQEDDISIISIMRIGGDTCPS